MKWDTARLSAALLLGVSLSGAAAAQVAKYGEVAKAGDYESYIAQDGAHYKIGDTIKIGMPQGGNKSFTFVLQNQFMAESIPCTSYCAGLEYKIVGFRAADHRQNFRMWARLQGQGRFNPKLSVNFENALQAGEIIGKGYTSDQALAELKKWKDKLDLELITQDEYDRKKAELTPYIR